MTVTYKVVRHKQVGNHYVVRAENVDPTTEEVIRELSPTENPLNYPEVTCLSLNGTRRPS